MDGIEAIWMRGGTSKGLYMHLADLPGDVAARDDLLLRLMGSPDPRQIDGVGGADPLASKVALLGPSSREDADVDYLFLQIFVDQALVSDAQACGNILAGVGPAAIEMGLVRADGDVTEVRIHMLNTGEVAVARVQTPGGVVRYDGDAAIDGVPGTAAPIELMFTNIAGSMCGALLPSGQVCDVVEGVACTLIDNGMPVVLMRAADLGLRGNESPAELEADATLKERVEAIRLAVGPLMNLGDVREKSVPKMALISPAQNGGAVNTRSFIPHRCHSSIGVFAAVSVASACTLEGSVAYDMAVRPEDGRYAIEHPSGAAEVMIRTDATGAVTGAGTLRTARKLMQGRVFPRR
ncbi:4-oxalomesaconate tautomerase [Donghicola sp. C2-DW-16]|uniref:4-oxalomesaconate tautomerase n=2 Tax=Donghicola mangrovi TaxID=2729614 RepID=A0ABX2PE99_9RHOB|nr:4-oxalomesaconate tautomerase [Donghicola mangrovi]